MMDEFGCKFVAIEVADDEDKEDDDGGIVGAIAGPPGSCPVDLLLSP